MNCIASNGELVHHIKSIVIIKIKLGECSYVFEEYSTRKFQKIRQ
ncbi:protein of unknown function [Tepidibacter aestuarii]|nr:protein of unknown function [Tepidibacter aestuarii]